MKLNSVNINDSKNVEYTDELNNRFKKNKLKNSKKLSLNSEEIDIKLWKLRKKMILRLLKNYLKFYLLKEDLVIVLIGSYGYSTHLDLINKRLLD